MTAPESSKLLCTVWGTAESHRVLFRPDVDCPYCEISHQANEIERLRARETRMLEWLNYYRAKWMGEAAMPCPPVPESLDLQERRATPDYESALCTAVRTCRRTAPQ